MTKLFEVKMRPKRVGAIVHLIVRLDDPENIQTMDDCLDFLEKELPDYTVEHIVAGYKSEPEKRH